MNDFLKLNEMMEFLKANEKNEINQFKKQLEQQLSNNESTDESKETPNKVSNNTKQSDNKNTDTISDNKNTDTISDKESVSEHFETTENISREISNENNSIETTEKISEKISEEISQEISNHNIIQKTISTNTQTEFVTNEIQNDEIQNENDEIQNDEIQNDEIQNYKIQNYKIQNEIKNNYIKTDIGFVLFCFDHRFINNTNELLKRDPTIKSFDYFSLAGGSLGFLKNELGCWDKTCIEHIELAQKLHNIKKIIIIDHEDCEMYKDYYKDLKKHPKREKKYHINNLTELMEIFEKQFELTVDAFILNLDGSFIKI